MGAIAKRQTKAVEAKVVQLERGELVPVSVRALPLDQQPMAVYLGTIGKGSVRTMRQALTKIAELLTANRAAGPIAPERMPWSELRYQHTAAIRSRLADKDPATGKAFAPATANKMLSALRGVLKEAWRLGQMDAEAYHRATDIKSIKGDRLLRGREVGAGEVTKLFQGCADDENTTRGARDAAMLSLLFAGGLRRAEVAALDLGDFNPEDGELRIRGGKGNKDRKVFIGNGALDAVADWLTVRGSDPGPLLLPINKSGKAMQRRLSTETIRKALGKLATDQHVKGLSPHDARRTFVSDLLDAGSDIATVQALAGHASPQTTSRYDRRGDRAKKKAAGLLAVPYTRRR